MTRYNILNTYTSINIYMCMHLYRYMQTFIKAEKLNLYSNCNICIK